MSELKSLVFEITPPEYPLVASIATITVEVAVAGASPFIEMATSPTSANVFVAVAVKAKKNKTDKTNLMFIFDIMYSIYYTPR